MHKRHRFPPEIIQHVVWLYHRFNLSSRNIENLMAERGITASYESSPTGLELMVSLIESLSRIQFTIPPNMPIIVQSYHISQRELESVACASLSRLVRHSAS